MPPVRHLATRHDAAAGTAQLRDVVQAWLQRRLARPISRATARRLIVAGAVTVDGRLVTLPGWEVRPGARLEARVDLGRLPPATENAPAAPLVALYEDEDLIAVDKPAGVPTVPGADPRRPSIVRLLQAQLAAREGLDVAGIYLGVHQRLDVETSGVLVFTKRHEANRGLGDAFARHTARKLYVALTTRPATLPAKTWSVSRPVVTPENSRAAPGGGEAVTRFSLARVLARALLVEARPLTGRKHQVRIHLASCGLPVLGDTRYGGPSRAASIAVPRVMLHASRLEITHPTTAAPLAIEAPLPADFMELLRALGQSG